MFESEFELRPLTEEEFEEYKKRMEKFLKESEELLEKLKKWSNLSEPL